MAKSLQSQFKGIERDMVREMNKMVKRANKKINPVILPTQLDSTSSALNFNEYHQDNSTHVSVGGDMMNSQIGGRNNSITVIYTDTDIEKILENIKEYSRTLKDEEQTELVTMLHEIQMSGKVENHMIFFDKHPILAMAFSAIVTWGIDNGMDSLVNIISRVFE